MFEFELFLEHIVHTELMSRCEKYGNQFSKDRFETIVVLMGAKLEKIL